MLQMSRIAQLCAGALNRILGLYEKEGQRARARADRVSTYLKEISDVISKMVDKFEKGRAPRQSGNELKQLLIHLDTVMYGIYDRENKTERRTVESIAAELHKLLERAEQMDEPLRKGMTIPTEQLEWVREMERTAGQLSGAAAMIKAIEV